MTARAAAPSVLCLLAVLAAATAAGAQTVGPEPEPAAPAPAPAPGRLALGLHYGFAAFTPRDADAVWYEGAPTGPDTDLETSAVVGLEATWAVGPNLHLGLRGARQATRLASGEGEERTRTDLALWHAQAEVEATFGGGRTRPLLALAAGGTLARPAGGDGTWHWSAAPAAGMLFAASDRVRLRLALRAPLIWAGGQLVPQIEPAAGLAVTF